MCRSQLLYVVPAGQDVAHTEKKNLLDEKNTSSQPEFITKKKKESGFLQYYILYIAVARAELPEKLPMDFKPIFSRLT